MNYRNADGSTMPEFTIAARAKKAKQREASRKAVATKSAAVKVPKLDKYMTTADYIVYFDRLNSLKPCDYAMAGGNAHFGFVDGPVSVELEQLAA